MARTSQRKRKSTTNHDSSSKSSKTSKTSRTSRTSPSTKASKLTSKSNFLSQLETLRTFLNNGTEDENSSFSEHDLSTCLRQCGYNVQLAAEHLLTGQYQCTSKTKKSNFFTATTTMTKRKNTKTLAAATTKPESRDVIDISSSDSDYSCSNNNNNGSSNRTSNNDEVCNNNHKSNVYQKQKRIKKESNRSIDKSISSSSLSGTSKKANTRQGKSTSIGKLLLCQRWIVALSTTRNGCMQYHEKVDICTGTRAGNTKSMSMSTSSSIKKQCNIIRFKGKQIEGTFDSNISNFLSPLLSYINSTANTNTNTSSSSSSSSCIEITTEPLIEIQAQGIMYDNQIRIGSEVPLEVSIYITQPKLFFSLFDDGDGIRDNGLNNGHNDSHSHNHNQWYTKKSKRKDSSSDSVEKVNKQCKNVLKNAAFNLLQWAHYGDVPLFEPLPSSLSSSTSSSSLSKKVCNENDAATGEENMQKSQNDDLSIDNFTEEENIDNISKDKLIENEDNAPIWVENIFNDELHHKGNEGKGGQGSGQKQETSSSKIQEENDPDDLNSKGTYLHKYQRQALFWMLNREKNANATNNVDFHKQLEFLSELASESSSCNNGRGHCNNSSSRRRREKSHTDYHESKMADSEIGVKCEVGPVIVSKEMASKSITLDGIEGPVHHPLWTKRFLWDKDFFKNHYDSRHGNSNNGVYTFFVNELLQTVSKSTPNPPSECCGGILADSMGLGKTVMLLSLICKDKETLSTKLCISQRNGHTEDKKIETYSVSKKDKAIESNICTLVITPLSLLPQWEEEIRSKTTLTYGTYYGDLSHRSSLGSNGLEGLDILITTYGTLQSEFRSNDKRKVANFNIFNFCFRRVILDESHLIKNPSTAVSKACCAIKAEKRWCVTGTPVINSLDDIYGLLKFLKHEPWSDSSFWKNLISRAMTERSSDTSDSKNAEKITKIDGSNGGMQIALNRARRILSPLLLRRTKDMVDDNGAPILALPPIDRKTVKVVFNGSERHFYEALLEKSQSIFEGFISAGTASKSWFAIFSLLQRLRQACDHLSLTVKPQIDPNENINQSEVAKSGNSPLREGAVGSSRLDDDFLRDLLNTFNQHQSTSKRQLSAEQQEAARNHSENVALSLSQYMDSDCNDLSDECSICLDIPERNDIAITPCSHIFCRRCLLDTLNWDENNSIADPTRRKFGKCPFCMASIEISQIKFTGCSSSSTLCEEVSADEEVSRAVQRKDAVFNARETLEAALKGRCSSKITAILNELDHIWELDPRSKVVIFSQYLGMLDLIRKELINQEITHFKFDGKMSLNQRREILGKFSSPTKHLTNDDDQINRNHGSVLLASMKACGVGLNLVSASTVFIVDPWWNDAMEDQCVNRVHRIGQLAKIVRMRKFIVSDSVEEKIVEMQERKKGVATELLSNQKTGNNSGSNPTLDDFKTIFGR